MSFLPLLTEPPAVYGVGLSWKEMVDEVESKDSVLIQFWLLIKYESLCFPFFFFPL